MDIYEQIRAFRKALLLREADARQQMRTSYAGVQERLKELLADLQGRIEQKRAERTSAALPFADGQEVSVSWLYREARYQALLSQVEAEVERFGQGAALRIEALQRESLATGARDAARLLDLLPPFLPAAAAESAVGALQDGTALADHLAKLAPLVRDQVKRALLTGIVAGQPARVVAKRVQAAADLAPRQAERLVRTEMMRAYREGSLATYQEHPELVSGWIWVATLSARSCAACIALHGSVHPLSEPFGSHPNCRCSPAPWVEGVSLPESGESWLLRQDEETIARVLGPAGRPDGEAARALRSGQVKLGDFVVTQRSDRWGVTRRARTLSQAREAAKGKKREISRPRGAAKAKMDALSREMFQEGPASVQIRRRSGVADREEEIFGERLAPEKYALLVGAPDDSRVDVFEDLYENLPAIRIETVHPLYDGVQKRYIFREERGIVIHNDLFRVKKDGPRGVALRVLARQVREAQRAGVVELELLAYGGPNMPGWNGYYTWPRYGYDWQFSPGERIKLQGTPFADARAVSDLMRTPEGRDWWKANGWTGNAIFDLQPDSNSVRSLLEYMQVEGVIPYEETD